MKNREIIWLPTQKLFWNATEKIVCWIAGIGAGKTRMLSWWVLEQSFKYPKNFGQVACATGTQLKISTVPSFLEEWDRLGVVYKYNEQKNTVHFNNGSWLKFQTLDVPAEQLKGSELGWLGVDEVDACKERHVTTLISRVRRKGASRLVRLIGNSPPPEHWVEKRFQPKDGSKPLGKLLTSTTYENFFLPPDYVEMNEILYPKGTPEHDRYMLGKMGVALPDAIWPQYERKIHLVSKEDVPSMDRMVGSFYGLDLGHKNPTCLLKCYLCNDATIWVVGEHYESMRSMKWHADHIKSMYEGGPIFCDHDAQYRFELEQLGVRTTPAYKAVSVGLEYVRQRFRDQSVKIVREWCPNLVRELPGYQYIPDSPDETVMKKDDHSLDALRYAVCGLDHQSIRDTYLGNLIYGALN